LKLKTPDQKKEIILSGKIDRIDLDLQRCKYTVIDYKLNGQSLAMSDVVHGLMLQLLTYLLVINASGEKLTGKKLSPAAAFYQKVARSLSSVENPDEAPEPDDPEYLKIARPEGVINIASKVELDGEMETEIKSKYYAMTIKKDGEIAKAGQLVSEDQFDDLIKYVEKRIVELCDAMMKGDIAVAPYLIGKRSPCARCAYQSVCRFDKLINSYRVLNPLERDRALVEIQNAVRGEAK
jgi:ATP-dependent helicase/nuclease subunit B